MQQGTFRNHIHKEWDAFYSVDFSGNKLKAAKKKYIYPWNPKPMEKWRCWTPNIWVITSKNEGYSRFPWQLLTLGFFTGYRLDPTGWSGGETSEFDLFFTFLVDLVLWLTVANFPQNKRTRNGCLGGRKKTCDVPKKMQQNTLFWNTEAHGSHWDFLFFWNDDFRKNQHGIVFHMTLKGLYLVDGWTIHWICKICSSNWIISRGIGVNIKNVWNHRY